MKYYLLPVVLAVCVFRGNLCTAQSQVDFERTTNPVCSTIQANDKSAEAETSHVPSVTCKDRHSVRLSWKASATLSPSLGETEGYIVYRWQNLDGSCFRTKQPVKSTNYEDCQVEAGQTYRYAVTAVKQSNESEPTNVVEATIPSLH
jgi:fibronectin type 3 domain-containing protein